MKSQPPNHLTMIRCPANDVRGLVFVHVGYHLTTDNICLANSGACAHGVVATGTDCTVHHTEICTSCDGGYFLDGSGICLDTLSCTCAHGTPATFDSGGCVPNWWPNDHIKKKSKEWNDDNKISLMDAIDPNRKDLGFEHQYSLKQGLQRLIDWREKNF